MFMIPQISPPSPERPRPPCGIAFVEHNNRGVSPTRGACKQTENFSLEKERRVTNSPIFEGFSCQCHSFRVLRWVCSPNKNIFWDAKETNHHPRMWVYSGWPIAKPAIHPQASIPTWRLMRMGVKHVQRTSSAWLTVWATLLIKENDELKIGKRNFHAGRIIPGLASGEVINHGDRFRLVRIGLWDPLLNGSDLNRLQVLGWSSK